MKIKINKAIPGIPMVYKRSFTFSTRSYGSHCAEVILTKDGEYSMNIDGHAYSPHEAAAKRSSQYKSAVMAVSIEMQQAMEAYNDAFINLAIQTVSPSNRLILENQLNQLVLNKYIRQKCMLPKPSKSDVESDLREEADAKFFSVWKGKSSQKKQFISENIETEYHKRLSNWEELKRYHEAIQDYFEAQTNKQYQKEYNKNKKAIEDDLYGDTAFVIERFKELPNKLKLPFDITLECGYDKKSGVIDAVASLPSLLYIPDKKAVSFATGKIGVKDKLKREVDEDTVKTMLGLSYYLAGYLFSLSFNVNIVRLSVMAGYSAYYWIEFNRKSFTSLRFSCLNPIQDFFRHPNVIDYKKTSIALIEDSIFRRRIRDAIKVADALAGNGKLVALSIKEAESICKNVAGTDDLKQALKEAKSNMSTIVLANKKYQNILNEIEDGGQNME